MDSGECWRGDQGRGGVCVGKMMYGGDVEMFRVQSLLEITFQLVTWEGWREKRTTRICVLRGKAERKAVII